MSGRFARIDGLGDGAADFFCTLRQLGFTGLDEEAVEAATVLDRAQRVGGDAETERLTEGFGHQGDVAQVRQEPATGLQKLPIYMTTNLLNIKLTLHPAIVAS